MRPKLLIIVFNLFFVFCFAQTWTKLGKQNWPTNPYNLSWGPNAVGNIGNGQVTSIWNDPDNSNHVLIGVFSGGIYESFNAIDGYPNVVWKKLTTDIPTQSVRKIERNNNEFFATSSLLFSFGNRHFSNTHGQFKYLHGLGVIKSIDGGQNWSIPIMNNDLSRGFDSQDFTKVTANGVMYGISRKRVYKSIDYGNTWNEVGGQIMNGIGDVLEQIVADPNDSNNLWLSARGGPSANKIYKSIDGGNSWQEKDYYFKNLSGSSSPTNTFSILNYSGELFVMMQNSNATVNIFKSNDWQNFTNVKKFYNSGNFQIKINYANGKLNYYLLGMPGLYSFTDSTPTNSSLPDLINNKTHVDSRSIGFSHYNNKDYIFLGNDGGISYSDDNGNTWKNITGNLVAHIIDDMGYYTDPNRRIFDLGTQDCGWYRNKLTIPYNESQTFMTNTWEGMVYTSPHTGRVYFQGSPPSFSDDDGATKTNFSYRIEDMIEDPLDVDIRYHPAYDNTAILFNQNQLANVFPQEFSSINNVSLKFKVALNSNKNIIFPISYHIEGQGEAPLYSKLVYSNDRGLSWKDVGVNIKNADVGLPDIMNTSSTPLSGVTGDDYNPNRMWAIFGAAAFINQKVYETNDFGKTWVNISFNLSDIQSLGLPINTPSNYPVNYIEYDENRNILFLGTDYGVFYLDRSTNKWKVFGQGLPRAVVTNIFIDDYYNEIVVGTAGSGVWSAPLSDCKDLLLMEQTDWVKSNNIICGDLRVKKEITLNLFKSNIAAKNIILEPNSKIIWSTGLLNKTNANSPSFLIGSRGSILSLTSVTTNDYIVNNFENSTLNLGNNIFNNTEINIFGGSYFDYTNDSQISLNNSNLNFYSNYYYKTHNPKPNNLNSFYLSNLSDINMIGNGRINVYDKNILIQNETLVDKLNPIVNNGRYYFQANNGIKTGNNIQNTLLSGDVLMNSYVDLIAKNFIEFYPGTELNSYVFARIDPLISEDLSTPYGKFAATDSEIVYSDESSINKFTDNFKNKSKEMDDIEITEEDSKKENLLEIYPIPAVDKINYKLNSTSLIGAEYSLVDMNGRLIMKGKFLSERGEISISNIQNNIFLLIFNLNGKMVSKKILRAQLTDDKGFDESNK